MELTKYIKIFELEQERHLCIAHAKVNKDFDKIFDKLNFPQQKRLIKPFTHPKGDSLTRYNATSCKSFPLKSFSGEFKTILFALFNLEQSEASQNDVDEGEDDSSEADGQLTQSQDHPHFSQSQGGNTLRVCR